MLELCSAPPENLPGTKPEAGTCRFSGEMRNGSWNISAVYPPVNAKDLTDALALARETLDGEGIRVSGEEEGREILAKAMRMFHFMLEENSAKLKGGVLRMKRKSADTLSFYGAAAFAVRYAQSWMADAYMSEDEDDDDDEDEFLTR